MILDDKLSFTEARLGLLEQFHEPVLCLSRAEEAGRRNTECDRGKNRARQEHGTEQIPTTFTVHI